MKLHSAMVGARLADKRAALLAGLDPRVVASLRSSPSPSEQLLLDLTTLGGMKLSEDEGGPLAILFANVLALLGRPSADEGVPLEVLLSQVLALLERASPAGDALDERRGPALASDQVGVPAGTVQVRLYNLSAACEWTIQADPLDGLVSLIDRLKTLLKAQSWGARDVPKPGRGYQFRFYANDDDTRPLSPATTVAELLPRHGRASLSLNVEWYRAFRGEPPKTFR